MTYDLIIVAQSTTPRLVQMTQDCIDSSKADNVILIETGTAVDYSGVDRVVRYAGDFNYNRALNMGLEYANNDIHILANNDLIFYNYKTIGEDMISHGFGSASAWYNGCAFDQGSYIYEGYNIATHITGWCLFITSEALSKIGKINEKVEFWYSDNVYADQLKAAGIRHGLFCNARVDHIGSQTLSTVSVKLKRYYSLGQLPKYHTSCGRKR